MKKDVKDDIYGKITASIIASIESGVMPWLKPWQGGSHVRGATNALMPFNGYSGRNYNGINSLYLMLAPFERKDYYTFKQCRELGGSVKKGSKGNVIVFWSVFEKPNKDNPQLIDKIPVFKYDNVFNFEQCEGLPEIPKQVKGEPLVYTSLDSLVKDDLGIKLQHGGDSAYYSPSHDLIAMPHHKTFVSEAHYSATLMHELTHATLHESRCNRVEANKGRFGSESYAFEELVAELGSAFLGAELGIEPLLQHNASYIASWLKVLKDDNSNIIKAASQAKKACEWVLTNAKKQTNVESQIAA